MSNSKKPGWLLTPWDDVTPEMEEEAMDFLAREVVRRGLESPAIFFLETIKPMSIVGANTVGMIGAPFLETIGVQGFKWYAVFNNYENVEKIIQKIEFLLKEKKQQEKVMRRRAGVKPGFFERLKERFRSST